MLSIRNLCLLSLTALIPLVSSQKNIDIVKGSQARPGTFPFIVSLHLTNGDSVDDDFHICGGTIINTATVLTAAHCCVGNTADQLGVRYGTHDLNSGGATTKVNKIILHPKYNLNGFLEYDFCILHVDPIDFNVGPSDIAIITEVDSNNYDNIAIVAAGWGLTNGNATKTPTDLRYALLQGFPRPQCKTAWGAYNVNITHDMFCTTAFYLSDPKSATCRGDSGGPLVDQNSRYLLGVTSFGITGCHGDLAPTVFGNVYAVRSWIFDHLI